MGPLLPYGRQSVSDDDVAAVAAVLRSDFLTTGSVVEEFEARFAVRVGAKHAVAVNSATSALHLAMRVAGIGAGDRVITSPITFVASANCAAFVGAIPDFADIDPVSYTLSPQALAAMWTPDVKAVIPVHYAGQTADMPRIASIARERNAMVIEDACHAAGGDFWAERRRHPVGGHPWADMSIFSFHPVKSMTTGEGGMLVTNDSRHADLARRLRSHGIVRGGCDFAGLGDATDGVLNERGPWYQEMTELGYNYRLTDIHCALGISQLSRLDEFLGRRREIVRRYNEAFAGRPLLAPPALRTAADRDCTSWHLYTLLIDFARLGKTRTTVMNKLRSAGVGTQVLYIPVYLQPWYRRSFGYRPGKCPQAEAFYARALSLPLFPAMTDRDVARVISAVLDITSRS